MSKKKKHESHNGSQKGRPYSEAEDTKNVMAKEELEKAIHPERSTMDDG
ncbi:hypothetical protein [Pontibacillus yanchengensis]|nr:hypothetical protein [Pontibacillus yanchengensis]